MKIKCKLKSWKRKCKNKISQYPRRIIKIVKQTLTILSGGDINASLNTVLTEYEMMVMKPLKNMMNDMEKCISNTTCITWNILQLIYP